MASSGIPPMATSLAATSAAMTPTVRNRLRAEKSMTRSITPSGGRPGSARMVGLGGLDLALGVDQEVGGGDDALALLQPGQHLHPPVKGRAERHRPGHELVAPGHV